MAVQIHPVGEISTQSNVPSLLYNNLISPANNMLGYVSGDTVITIRREDPHRQLTFKTGEPVRCLRCTVPCDPAVSAPLSAVVAVGSNRSHVIVNNQHRLSVTHSKNMHGLGTCAAISVGPSQEPGQTEVVVHVVIGTDTGHALFAEHKGLALSDSVLRIGYAVRSHEHHTVTAAALCVTTPAVLCFAATGDSHGVITLWRLPGQVGAHVRSADPLDCVTSLVFVAHGKYIAAAYGCGRVRLIESIEGAVMVDVCAHSLWINAMSYSPELSLLATAAEDGVVMLWRLDPTGDGVLVHPSVSVVLANQLPTGLAFSAGGRILSVVSYGAREVVDYAVPLQ